MDKVNLEILEHDDKTGESFGRYFRFKTSQGWMACFPDFKDKNDFTLINSILAQEGKGVICVGISTNEKGSVIQKFFGSEDLTLKADKEKSLPPPQSPLVDNEKRPTLGQAVNKDGTAGVNAQEQKSVKEEKYEPTSMYVSYAKDIFCEMIGSPDTSLTKEQFKHLMETSIGLVKQAQKAFS